MKLVIGGQAQGKLSFVLSHYPYTEEQISVETSGKPVRYHLEQYIRFLLQRGEDPIQIVSSEIAQTDIFICDEVGCGVVPMDAEERQWRDQVGRVCCMLAQQADEVIRIHCGLPQWIKGGTK